MSRKFATVSLLSACLITATGFAPAFAQKAATSTSVKVGYFNLALVKQSFPEARESENLQIQADNQLKRDVEEGNKRIEKAKEEKKPAEEIQRMVTQLQGEINAKQQALVQLIQSNQAQANQRIIQAANVIAQEKGLDLVLDGAGVFAGGQKIVDSGVDITQDVMKRLNPTLAGATQAPATASTPPKSTAK